MDTNLKLKQIGNNFVCDYYSTLSKFPHNLSKYYKNNSIFVHSVSATDTQSVVGQKDIHDCIVKLDYKGCSTNIISVNTQKINKYIVISVIGKLTKHNDIQNKFSQTIVLDRNDDDHDEYVIKNNMVYFFDYTEQNNNRDKVKTITRKWSNNTHENEPTLYQIDESSYLPISHQLFITGIPANTKSKDLKTFFEQYGKLHSIRIMKRNVNYGFITYDKSKSTQKVLQNRPIIFPDNNGVWLVVKEKKNTMKNKDNDYLPNSHQLFIGDIPDNVTCENLKDFFNMWGNVVNSRVFMVEEKKIESTRETVNGYVTFESEEDAKTVLKNGQIMFPNKNGIRLNVMNKCYKPSGNKNTIPKELKKTQGW